MAKAAGDKVGDIKLTTYVSCPPSANLILYVIKKYQQAAVCQKKKLLRSSLLSPSHTSTRIVALRHEASLVHIGVSVLTSRHTRIVLHSPRLQVKVITDVDVLKDDVGDALKAALSGVTIDVLVNNAGSVNGGAVTSQTTHSGTPRP